MLKEKVEEISVDLNVFQQGGMYWIGKTCFHFLSVSILKFVSTTEILNQTDASGEARSAVEVLQLERQNQRLKDALVR
jgi:hypothetical protein